MNNAAPSVIERADYAPANFAVERMDMCFDLDASATLVRSTMVVHRNADAVSTDLVLDGCELELVSIQLDGRSLTDTDYTLEPLAEPTVLTIHNVPARAVLEVETRINPGSNTVLEGLYLSSGNFCTQCEAEGFRRITWYPDRPDVMARFSVKIIADKSTHPVLLSNGNELARGELTEGRHWVSWEDPWPKPSYLFALVAGDLSSISDQFVTASGRTVDLHIYVQQHNIDKCDHAMSSLLLAMRWDEEVFGLEYDLDRYMIVAVDDFNMGAMENKGLNIFNSKYVLADQATATDSDFLGIESVIAHEYFHNWTGNRVTCRDWFQLSLKEGLTVFRDQEFSADHHSRAVKRIEDVRLLRARQFPEDAGPMAHPVRPESYIEINNFYTLTIYEKGAELIRMMHTLIGAENFRSGMDLYFNRHDGQAATCEDFVLCMEAASSIDLGQFRLWYSQMGTPQLSVTEKYDADKCTYTLSFSQSVAAVEDQPSAKAMHIPVAVSLFASDGVQMRVQPGPEEGLVRVLDVTSASQEFRFTDVAEKPVPSLLRGFSAPVMLDFDYSDEDLAFLLAHETDPFNRWEAGQRLVTRVIENFDCPGSANSSRCELLIQAYKQALRDDSTETSFRAELLSLPGIETIAERHEIFQVDRIASSRKAVQRLLAQALEDDLAALVSRSSNTVFSVDTQSMGNRALSNVCLDYLARLENPEWIEFVRTRFKRADNMTDEIAALGLLVEFDQHNSAESLLDFYQRWKSDRLVIDKWFAIQAMAELSSTVERVAGLLDHEDFDLTNPNRVRSLLGAFSMSNPVAFHQPGGGGYRLVAEQIVLLDDINPQVAARLTSPLTRWQKHDAERQFEMKQGLQMIAEKPGLSNDVYEVVHRALGR